MQELTLRHERAMRRLEDMRLSLDEMRTQIAAGTQVLLDLHETVQAQNRALFKVLDRLA